MATILLVDHHEFVRVATSKMLKRDGHDVETRSGRQRLLHDCHAVNPDILIVEENRLQQVALHTLQALRDQIPGLTIIAMSSRGSDASDLVAAARSAAIGADRTLNKPIDCTRLRTAIQEAMTENRDSGRRGPR